MASKAADPEYTSIEVIDFLNGVFPSASNKDANRKKSIARFRDFLSVPPLKGIYDDDVILLFKGNKPPPSADPKAAPPPRGGVEGLLSRCGDKSHEATKDEGFKRTARDAMELVAWLLFRARTAEDGEVPPSPNDFSTAPPLGPMDITGQSPTDSPRNIFYQTFIALPVSCYKSMRLNEHLKEWPNGDKLRQGHMSLACTFIYVILSARLPTRKVPQGKSANAPPPIDDDESTKAVDLPDLLPEPDAQRVFRTWLEKRENDRREQATKKGDTKAADKVSPVVSYILIGTFQSSNPDTDADASTSIPDQSSKEKAKEKTPEEEEEEDRLADKIGHQLGLYSPAVELVGAPTTWEMSDCRQIIETRFKVALLREEAKKARQAREEAKKLSALAAAPGDTAREDSTSSSFADAVAEAAAASLLGDDDEGTLLSASSSKKYHQDQEAARETALQREVEEERRKQLRRDPLGIRPPNFDLSLLQNTRNHMQGRSTRTGFAAVIDRDKLEEKREAMSNRRKSIIGSMSNGVGRDPAAKDLETNESHKALAEATANAALSCGGSVLPTDHDFDPLLFLTLVHGKVQHAPLVDALERLNSTKDDQEKRLQSMVRDNFSLFARCADGMDWYADNFEVGNVPGASAQVTCNPPAQKNPKDGGFSKTSKKGPKKLDYLKAHTVTSRLSRLADYSTSAQDQAKDAFKPLLDKTASIRAHKNAMTKLRHIAGVLSVPAVMREHLDHGRVAEAVNAYRGVRFIDERCGVEILRSAKAKALEVAEDARKALTKILSDEGASTSQLLIAVRDMIDLDELDQGTGATEGDGSKPATEKIENPALLCLQEQTKHLKTIAESTVKRFESTIEEAVKREQAKSANGPNGVSPPSLSSSSALIDDRDSIMHRALGVDSGSGTMSLSSPAGKRFYLYEEEDWGVNGGGEEGRSGDGSNRDGDLDGESAGVTEINTLRVSAIAKVHSLIKVWLPRLIRIATTAFEREEALKGSSDAEKYEIRAAVDGTFGEKTTVEVVLNREVADTLLILLRIAGECTLGVVEEESIRPRGVAPTAAQKAFLTSGKDSSGHISGSLKNSATKQGAVSVPSGPVGLFSVACSSKLEKQLPAAQCGKCSRILSHVSEYVRSCVASRDMFAAGASREVGARRGWLGDDNTDVADGVGGSGRASASLAGGRVGKDRKGLSLASEYIDACLQQCDKTWSASVLKQCAETCSGLSTSKGIFDFDGILKCTDKIAEGLGGRGGDCSDTIIGGVRDCIEGSCSGLRKFMVTRGRKSQLMVVGECSRAVNFELPDLCDKLSGLGIRIDDEYKYDEEYRKLILEVEVEVWDSYVSGISHEVVKGVVISDNDGGGSDTNSEHESFPVYLSNALMSLVRYRAQIEEALPKGVTRAGGDGSTYLKLCLTACCKALLPVICSQMKAITSLSQSSARRRAAEIDFLLKTLDKYLGREQKDAAARVVDMMALASAGIKHSGVARLQTLGQMYAICLQ